MSKELYLVLHNIRSAHNVGALFRTADGAGVEKIYLTGYTPAPSEEKKLYVTQAQKMIAKTALGAEKNISWEKAEDIKNILKKMKEQGVKIVALEQDEKAVDYKKFKPSFPMALILGNEVGGLEKEILDFCDAIISIPMRGKKESLNVSVAGGIAIYEIMV